MTLTSAGGRRTAVVASATVEDGGLRWVATLFALSVLVHNADHLRRGADILHPDVFWTGVLALVVETALVILVFARHRIAPLASMVGGFGLALGYFVVHFTPARSWLSDSLLSPGKIVSITAAGLETLSAIVLCGAGARMVADNGLATPDDPDRARARGQGWRHPVPLAVLVGNTAILTGSLLQRIRA